MVVDLKNVITTVVMVVMKEKEKKEEKVGGARNAVSSIWQGRPSPLWQISV